MLTLSLNKKTTSKKKSLIDLNKSKDFLTQALVKEQLEILYFSQLQISLATLEGFIFAICNFDNFTQINEEFGFGAGDKILENFVPIAKKNLRSSDMIIRNDGEEFIFILPALKDEKARDILNKIRIDFDDFVLEFEGKKISATLSFGMIEIDPENLKESDLSLEKALLNVKKQLSKAKNSGKNRVC